MISIVINKSIFIKYLSAVLGLKTLIINILVRHSPSKSTQYIPNPIRAVAAPSIVKCGVEEIGGLGAKPRENFKNHAL